MRLQTVQLAGLLWMFVLAASLTPAWGQQKIPLGLRMGDVSINKVPFLVAYDQGLYEKNGLEVTLVPFSASAARVHGVPDNVSRSLRDMGEDAEISIGGGAPGMVSKVNRSEPSDRVILATTDHVVHWHIVAQPGIETLEDLKGKRIAISSPAACTGVIAHMLAERMGWDPVQDIAILQGNYSVTPLIEGWADALIAYDVPLAMALVAGYKPMDFDMRAWNEPLPCSGVWASRSWAQDNRDTVIRFLKSLVEAIAMMKQDKTVAFESMAKWYDFTDYEVQNVIYNGAVEMPQKPYPAVDGIKRTMQLFDSNAMRRYKAEDFYDDSFMKELDESGFIDNLYK
jgi:NitT/TauT family transport system substrate-binding protein